MEEERKYETSSGFSSNSDSGAARSIGALNIGDWVDCVVEQIMPYGAFVRITEAGRKGMIHISELSFNFVKKVEDVLSLQQNIRAKIIKIDEKGRIDLSLKNPKGLKNEERRPAARQVQNVQSLNIRNSNEENENDSVDSFEKKMASFLKTSEAKIADLNSKAPQRSGRKRGGGRQSKGN